MNPSLLVARNVRIVTAGSRLAGAITDASPGDGGSLSVEAHTDFSYDGGTFVIEPGTINEEVGTYVTIDKARDLLIGIERPDPKDHDDGAFIQAGAEPYTEKVVDGHPDGDLTQIATGIPVRADIDTFLAPG